jgi:hypothetical protein
MQMRSLLAVLAACSAACGCAVPPDDPESVQQAKPEPAVRTGSRLPGTASGMTGQIGAEDYRNDRARQGSTADIMK